MACSPAGGAGAGDGGDVRHLGCKDAKLQHIQNLLRQVLMCLNHPEQHQESSSGSTTETNSHTCTQAAGMKCD